MALSEFIQLCNHRHHPVLEHCGYRFCFTRTLPATPVGPGLPGCGPHWPNNTSVPWLFRLHALRIPPCASADTVLHTRRCVPERWPSPGVPTRHLCFLPSPSAELWRPVSGRQHSPGQQFVLEGSVPGPPPRVGLMAIGLQQVTLPS